MYLKSKNEDGILLQMKKKFVFHFIVFSFL